jgi:anti-sigma B factor antagonist
MDLSLETREVGYVMIVRCGGRIVAGKESELLGSHIACLLRDRRAIVLNLGEVAFIDSSGLGAIVRGLNSVRQARGDLKLCNVTQHVAKVLELSRLAKLFEIYECEEKAVAAFYGPEPHIHTPTRTGPRILCVQRAGDVLSYLRELLLGATYDVQTSSQLGDALMLLRVTRFDLLVLGPGVPTSARQSIQAAASSLPLVNLGGEFSTLDAGEAATNLLRDIESHLKPRAGVPDS